MINTFLLSLRPSQQVGLLFVLLFGLLTAVSVYAFVTSLRERPDGDPRIQALKEFSGVLQTTWVMTTVFWVGWALGETVATVLFGIVAFFALREFITLSPTRQGDHRSLVLAFFFACYAVKVRWLRQATPVRDWVDSPPTSRTSATNMCSACTMAPPLAPFWCCTAPGLTIKRNDCRSGISLARVKSMPWLAGGRRVDSCRVAPRYALPLRPRCRTRPTDRAFAPGGP